MALTPKPISAFSPDDEVTGIEQVLAADGDLNRRISTEQMRAFARVDRLVSLVVDGDSKGVQVGNLSGRSALNWALAKAAVQVRYDPELDNCAEGGSVSGDNGGAITGLTSVGRLATMTGRVSAAVANGFAPSIILKIGANHVGGPTPPETILANVRKYWLHAKAAGAVWLLLMSVDPRTAGANSGIALDAAAAAQGHAINAAFRAFAAASPDVIFVDTHNALAAPGDGLFFPIGGFALSGTASMYDGLHESQYGAFQQGVNALATALARIAPPRRTISGAMVDADTGWSPTNPRGNVLGSSGRFGLTGGLVSQVTLAGGAGVTGVANWVPQRLMNAYPMLDGNLSGTLGVAIASVPYAPMADQGRPDQMATRLAFTGTPSADGNCSISCFVRKPEDWDHLVPLEFDADLHANALTGCHGLQLLIGAGGSGWGVGGNDAFTLPPINGRLRPWHPMPTIAPAVPGAFLSLALNIHWRAGVAMSGSIDLFGMGIAQHRPLPAPTP